MFSTNGTTMPTHGADLMRWTRDHSPWMKPGDPMPSQGRKAGLRLGDWVSPLDVERWGQIVGLDGDMVKVRFAGGDIADFTAKALRTSRVGIAEPFPMISSAEFNETDYPVSYLVENTLVAGEPMIIGGPSKCMKTSVMIDFALSLGTGTYFMNKFAVPKSVNVGVFSAESGAAAIKALAKRICFAKSRTLAMAKVWWFFKAPKLGLAEDLDALVATIRKLSLEVVVVDPLYLSLLAGVENVSASNVYEMGVLFSKLTEAIRTTSATPVLVHHFKKSNRQNGYPPPELDSLTMSGVVEFMRQWILIDRRAAYEPGSGRHDLWMATGGSNGHGGLFALDIDEGTFAEGRRWDVSIQKASEAQAERDKDRESAKDAMSEERRKKVLEALAGFPDGESKKVLRLAAGLNPDNFDAAIYPLIREGVVEVIELKKRNGSCDGYKLKPENPSESADQDHRDQRDQNDNWSGSPGMVNGTRTTLPYREWSRSCSLSGADGGETEETSEKVGPIQTSHEINPLDGENNPYSDEGKPAKRKRSKKGKAG